MRSSPLTPPGLRRYRILVHGRNLIYELDRGRVVGGFYVSCSVFAGSPEAAGEAAIELVRSDARFAESVLNGPDDPHPALLAEEVEVIAPSDDNPFGISTGFVWYAGDDDESPFA